MRSAMNARRIALAFAVLVVLAQPVVARAEPTAADKALAEALFRDGKKLMDEGQVADACPKFAESQRIDPKPGTLLNLAVCHEQEGKTASAWAELTEVVSVSTAMGQEERAEFAKTRALKLEGRLSRLLLEVTTAVPEMRIKLNQRTLSAAAVGSSIPVDPGDYTIEVTAPGKKAWSERLTIEAGPSTKKLVIPVLADAAKGPSEPVPVTPAPDRGAAQGGGVGDLLTLRTAGFIAGGLGVVGLGIGTVFGVRTFAKAREVEANCDGSVCNPTGLAVNDEAYTSATVSTVAFGAGLALLGAGAVLVLTSGSASKAEATGKRVWIAPDVAAGGGGITLGGRF